MTPRLRAVKGTRDLFPPESDRWIEAERLARTTFGSWGYGEVRTPVLEDTALFARSVRGDDGHRPQGDVHVPRPEGALADDAPGEHRRSRAGARRKGPRVGPDAAAAVLRRPAVPLRAAAGRAVPGVLADRGRALRGRGAVGRSGSARDALRLPGGAGVPGARPCRSTPSARRRTRARSARRCARTSSPGPVHSAKTIDGSSPTIRCDSSTRRTPTSGRRWRELRGLSTSSTKRRASTTMPCGSSWRRREFRSTTSPLSCADSTTTRAPFSRSSPKDLGAQDAILGGGRYDGLVESLGGPSMPAIGFAIGEDRLLEVAPLTAPRRPFVVVFPQGADDVPKRVADRERGTLRAPGGLRRGRPRRPRDKEGNGAGHQSLW